jgi:hypothetical protein
VSEESETKKPTTQKRKNECSEEEGKDVEPKNVSITILVLHTGS